MEHREIGRSKRPSGIYYLLVIAELLKYMLFPENVCLHSKLFIRSVLKTYSSCSSLGRLSAGSEAVQVPAEVCALLPASSECWQHGWGREGCVHPGELCSSTWVGNLKKLKTVME